MFNNQYEVEKGKTNNKYFIKNTKMAINGKSIKILNKLVKLVLTENC